MKPTITSNPKEYNAWNSMNYRCYNKNSPAYKNYGGRGIKVCRKWRNNFAKFYSDMGVCKKGLSLDRINNNGNYTDLNCRWSDEETQQNNTRANVHITYKGETKNISQWKRELMICSHNMYYRKKMGVCDEEIILLALKEKKT